MKTKKIIGFVALGVSAFVLILWILLVTMGSSFLFRNRGMIALIFILWVGSLVTAIVCLAGEVVRYFGRKNAEGYNDVYNFSNQYRQPGYPQQDQSQQGPGQGGSNFCPYCGSPITNAAAFCRNCGKKL